MIIRRAVCTICGRTLQEAEYGAGWPEWVIVDGISIDGDTKVMLCPEHKAMVADFIDKEKQHGVE